jgi:hypothetical protein
MTAVGQLLPTSNVGDQAVPEGQAAETGKSGPIGPGWPELVRRQPLRVGDPEGRV